MRTAEGGFASDGCHPPRILNRNRSCYLAPKVKSTLAVSPARTVTSRSCVPNVAVQID